MDDKIELALRLVKWKPGGFFRHQRALGGVSVCLGTPQRVDLEMGRSPLSNLCKDIKTFYGDKHR